MEPAELLIQHAQQRRTYETRCEYFAHLQPYLIDFQARHPEIQTQVERCFTLELEREAETINEVQRFSVQDVIIEGATDLSPLEQQLGIELPAFFREFYKRISGGVIMFMNPVILFDLAEMTDVALLYQQIDIENGYPDIPTTVLRFACIPPLPICFALRRHSENGRWSVVCLGDTVSRDEILDDELRIEESLEQWVCRLLETEGSPIALGRDYPPPLIRSDIRHVGSDCAGVTS